MSTQPAIFAIDQKGERHRIEVPIGEALMPALKGLEHGLAGVCGGVMSCGTCHVYISGQDAKRLPQPSDEERMLLDIVEDVRESSRASCQLVMTPGLDGLELTIAALG